MASIVETRPPVAGSDRGTDATDRTADGDASEVGAVVAAGGSALDGRGCRSAGCTGAGCTGAGCSGSGCGSGSGVTR